MDSPVAALFLKTLGITAALMAVIMVICIITPHLAKWIDKKRPRPTQDEVSADPDAPTVKGPYDASSDTEYDLNYKIYNKDIYGVEFKHGRKRQE